jgi:exodeoxyribonuclease VII large subunit
VDDVARAAGLALDNRLKFTRLAVQNRGDRIRALDPVATLRRGFSVVQKKGTGQVVASAAQVAGGDALSITVSDGSFPATAGMETKTRAIRKKRKPVADAATMKRLL